MRSPVPLVVHEVKEVILCHAVTYPDGEINKLVGIKFNTLFTLPVSPELIIHSILPIIQIKFLSYYSRNYSLELLYSAKSADLCHNYRVPWIAFVLLSSSWL